MDKVTFDMIRNFQKIENNIYEKLRERNIDSEEAEAILNDSVDYRERLLRIGKYSVKEDSIEKETFIKEKYEDVDSYIKLYVIYEYDNGMALCETTSGLIYLIPQKLLACYDEEITEDEALEEVESEYVVTYLDLKIDKFKTLFFDSKEDAEAKYKEVKSDEDCMSEQIQTKRQYEKYELGID